MRGRVSREPRDCILLGVVLGVLIVDQPIGNRYSGDRKNGRPNVTAVRVQIAGKCPEAGRVEAGPSYEARIGVVLLTSRRYSVFGIRYSVFGIRYSVFGIRRAGKMRGRVH